MDLDEIKEVPSSEADVLPPLVHVCPRDRPDDPKKSRSIPEDSDMGSDTKTHSEWVDPNDVNAAYEVAKLSSQLVADQLHQESCAPVRDRPPEKTLPIDKSWMGTLPRVARPVAPIHGLY